MAIVIRKITDDDAVGGNGEKVPLEPGGLYELKDGTIVVYIPTYDLARSTHAEGDRSWSLPDHAPSGRGPMWSHRPDHDNKGGFLRAPKDPIVPKTHDPVKYGGKPETKDATPGTVDVDVPPTDVREGDIVLAYNYPDGSKRDVANIRERNGDPPMIVASNDGNRIKTVQRGVVWSRDQETKVATFSVRRSTTAAIDNVSDSNVVTIQLNREDSAKIFNGTYRLGRKANEVEPAGTLVGSDKEGPTFRSDGKGKWNSLGNGSSNGGFITLPGGIGGRVIWEHVLRTSGRTKRKDVRDGEAFMYVDGLPFKGPVIIPPDGKYPGPLPGGWSWTGSGHLESLQNGAWDGQTGVGDNDVELIPHFSVKKNYVQPTKEIVSEKQSLQVKADQKQVIRVKGGDLRVGDIVKGWHYTNGSDSGHSEDTVVVEIRENENGRVMHKAVGSSYVSGLWNRTQTNVEYFNVVRTSEPVVGKDVPERVREYFSSRGGLPSEARLMNHTEVELGDRIHAVFIPTSGSVTAWGQAGDQPGYMLVAQESNHLEESLASIRGRVEQQFVVVRPKNLFVTKVISTPVALPAEQVFKRGNSGRTYTFESGRNDYTGGYGWRPLDLTGNKAGPAFDPVGNIMAIHDLMEHFPGDEYAPHNEYMAQGAMLYLRFEGEFWGNVRSVTQNILYENVVKPAFGMLFHHLIKSKLETKEFDEHAVPNPADPKTMPVDTYYALNNILAGVDTFVRANYGDRAQIERVLNSVRTGIPWIVKGYLRAKERYAGLDKIKLARFFKKTHENLPVADSNNVGSKIKVTLNYDNYTAEIESQKKIAL